MREAWLDWEHQAVPVVWEGLLRSEGQVTAFKGYRAQVNELTRLLDWTRHRCGTPAPGH